MKKVLVQILRYDSQLIKDDTVEELFLSFHTQILKSFFFHKFENNDCFFDYLFSKSNLSDFFRVYLKPGRKKIRFEIEVKKDEVKKFQHDFFTGQFERFEELLTEHFYHQAT